MKEIADRYFINEELNAIEQKSLFKISDLKQQYLNASKQYGKIAQGFIKPEALAPTQDKTLLQ